MRIAIFGGSFDPVHLGHMQLAKAACEKAQLDKLIFMPVYIQPFKQDRVPASGFDRIEMLKLARSDFGEVAGKFEISDFELKKEGVSYTVETLREFRRRYPEAEIFFVMGQDSLLKVSTWMYAEEILTEYGIIVGMRPGCDNQKYLLEIERLRETFGTEIIKLDNTQVDISSSEIRANVHKVDFSDDLLTESVERYVEENALYI